MSVRALCLTAATLAENLRTLHTYSSYIDGYELRVDFLTSIVPREIAQFPRVVQEELGRRLPAILTYRRLSDGGRYRGSEERRVGVMHEIVASQSETECYDYIDIEHEQRTARVRRELITAAQRRGTRVIVSIHNTRGGAENTLNALRLVSETPLVIPKVALMLNGIADVVTLYRQWMQYRARTEFQGREAILIGMGEYGLITRILAPKIGSYICYCSPTDAPQAASGHLSPELLESLYNFRGIDAQTKIYGIIGAPIAHTQSPHFHNAVFRKKKIQARYLPILCDDVEAFFELAELLEIAGVSVTIPHKRAVLTRLKGRDAAVTGAGGLQYAYSPRRRVVRLQHRLRGILGTLGGSLVATWAVCAPAGVGYWGRGRGAGCCQ